MLMTHFIWQTVLKQLSVTNAKNGAITPSLTPTMQARCYNAGKWVTDRNGRAGLGWGGGGTEKMCTVHAVTVSRVVLALGDLEVWRHFVRGLNGTAQCFIIKLSI